MHFTMSENALARKGERGSYFTRPNPKFTRQCERASGILHPWCILQQALCNYEKKNVKYGSCISGQSLLCFSSLQMFQNRFLASYICSSIVVKNLDDTAFHTLIFLFQVNDAIKE